MRQPRSRPYLAVGGVDQQKRHVCLPYPEPYPHRAGPASPAPLPLPRPASGSCVACRLAAIACPSTRFPSRNARAAGSPRCRGELRLRREPSFLHEPRVATSRRIDPAGRFFYLKSGRLRRQRRLLVP
ncbi:hypothetical protein ZWY2020_042954 [Hordeum vulgare]|nr:hypothetical protein ZWY2020_042954 [Hordeum vulgare]